MVEAGQAITRHMDALADELTVIMRTRVMQPFLERAHTEEDKARFEQTVSRLRQLTLEAVVSGFQQAANQVISRSLSAEPLSRERFTLDGASAAAPHSSGHDRPGEHVGEQAAGKPNTRATTASTRTRVGSTPK